MTKKSSRQLRLSLSCAALAAVLPIVANSATISSWNVDNVQVGATPPDYETGASVVYDGNPGDPLSVSSGQIVFSPPEAVSPGIKVVNKTYPDSGPGHLELAGCIMTSSAAECDSPFQSGKRIKQQMTGFGSVDLVFDTLASDATSVYQVFHRLINVTEQSLGGFKLELGTGVGTGFVAAALDSSLKFSSVFTAQPTGSGAANSQFPFGLFGDAASNPNFDLDGFFEPQRTGFDVNLTDTTLTSAGLYGPYGSYFGNWLSQEAVPLGAFWDFDNDPTTDSLLMAWETADGIWQARRGIDSNAEPFSLAESDWLEFATYEDLIASSLFASYSGQFASGSIEDLANLNLNFAIELGKDFLSSSFTLRTTVLPAQLAPVPLPAAGLLLMAGLGMLAAMHRRRAAA